MTFESALPYIFLLLMALAVLMYAILDGFDLGIGILLPHTNESFRNQMVASIGPFWDANETWLVLAVGILLIAFPHAHSLILKELYLPTLFLLVGLILRGVAFDFRAKAVTQLAPLWDKVFTLGSLMVSNALGFMLGIYVMGFDYSVPSILFALLSAIGVTAAFTYIGCAWLVLKTEGELQIFAARRGRLAGLITAIGVVAICIANPLINPEVADRWLRLPEAILLMPIPIFSFILLAVTDQYFKRVPLNKDAFCWLPFSCVGAIFLLCFIGLAYSFYPWVIPGKLLATEAASATASLKFVFYGVALVLPFILAYTFFSYRVFKGKNTTLEYY